MGNEVRSSFRSLGRRPGFVSTIVVTLGLGIGANTAIFSVVDSLLLRALPYEEPDRLVSVWSEGALPLAGLDLLRERSRSFAAIMGYGPPKKVTLTGLDEPARLEVAPVTPGFFSVLGIRPSHGRMFAPGDDAPGGVRPVVLSHDLLEERFRGDPDTVGTVVTLDGVEHRVVGVMPGKFRFPHSTTDLWVPIVRDAAGTASSWATYVQVVGRLRPDATLEGAQHDLDRVIPRVREGFPWPMPEGYGRGATAATLQDDMVGDLSRLLYLLSAAGAFALLIACVNVANLLLTRGEERRAEVATRAALGASRAQLVRQLAAESLLLGLGGGAFGLLLAHAGVDELRGFLPPGTPRLEEIAVDGRVVLFALGLTLATTLLFGLLPASRISRPEPRDVIRDLRAGSPSGARRRRLSAALVVSQVAVTAVLGVGAGLLVRTVWSLLDTQVGFRVENVLTADVAPPAHRFANARGYRQFYDRLLGRLHSLPTTDAAALADRIPFADQPVVQAFLVEERPFPTGGDWPLAEASHVVSAGYFRTLGIPLLRGRSFGASDRADTPKVAVVSRSLARRYWPEQDVLGQRIKLAGGEEWLTVVGVAGDVKVSRISEELHPALYRPLSQAPPGPMTIVARSRPARRLEGNDLRAVVRELDRHTPLTDVRPLPEVVGASLARERLGMALLLGFALLGSILSASGVYGVISRSVARRRHEIAVRLALGARRGRVVGGVVLQGAGLVLTGVVLGAACAFVLTRFLGGLVYRVDLRDPVTFASVAVILTAIGVLASYLPGRRAVRVDPVDALRSG